MFLYAGKRSKRRLHEGKSSVVQTYRIVPPSVYYPATRSVYFERIALVKQKMISEARHIRTSYELEDDFINFSKSETVRNAGTGAGIDSAFEKTDKNQLPELQVSEAGDLALEHSQDRKKVFYATPEKIEESNRVLRRIGSPVNLLARPDVALAAPDESGVLHFLQLVVPELGGQPDEFLGLVGDCGEFALYLLNRSMGDLFTVVLEQFGGQCEKDYFAKPIMKLWQFSSLLTKAANSSEEYSLAELTSSLRLKKNMPAYDNAASPLGRAFMMRRMGLERYVLPDVGEYYRIMPPFSTHYRKYYWGEDTLERYLEENKAKYLGENRDSKEALNVEPEVFTRITWNMHNAVVIAQSGTDRVTLENTPFQAVLRKEFLGHFNRFLLGVDEMQSNLKGFIKKERLEIPQNVHEREAYFLRFLMNNMKHSEALMQDWEKSLKTLLLEYMTQKGHSEGNFWGLHMYSSKPGQTFFDKYRGVVAEDGTVLRISMEDGPHLKALDNLMRDIFAFNLGMLPLRSLLPEVNEELEELNLWYPALTEECWWRMEKAKTREEKLIVMDYHNEELSTLTGDLMERVFVQFLKVYGFYQEGMENMFIYKFFTEMENISKQLDGEDYETAKSVIQVLLNLESIRILCPARLYS